jgi:DNA-binding NarL/FixJ family response regulator
MRKELTAKEQTVIELASFGLSNKQIATKLNIHVCTVSSHFHSIFQKLQADNRAHACTEAFKQNLLQGISSIN